MDSWPKISLVTPSFNQAAFIEATLRSVLDQRYPNLELLVVDGGSTDGTLEILRRYEGRLTWISEPDRGQAHAVNKGMARCTGEIVGYLNSDDLLAPGALARIAEHFRAHPDCMWLTGRCRTIDARGRELRQWITRYKELWLRLNRREVLYVLNFISQPATFWRREVVAELGLLREDLHYTMDYEYWLRIVQSYPLCTMPDRLADFRLHGGSKSGQTAHKQFDEQLAVARRYTRSPLLLGLHRLHNLLISSVYRLSLGKRR